MTDDTGRKWLSCFGWGCLAAVVIAVVGIGGCVAYIYKGGSDAHAVADSYLAAIDEGRYEDAYATLGPKLGGDRELGDFVAFEQAARSALGACRDWKMRGTSFNREGDRTVASLTYVGSCDSGAAKVALGLEKIDGSWLIQDIRYGDPPPPAAARCTECGRDVPAGANFCPFCGAAVGSVADADGDKGDTAE
jgi:hypothetical protein